MTVHDRLFIDGDWAESTGRATLEVISPHTEEVVGRTPAGTREDMDRAVAAARRAFDRGPWPHTDPGERAAAVGRLAGLLAERRDEVAALITEEMGCPVTVSRLGQVGEAQAVWSWFAELGAGFEWEDERAAPMGTVTVRREPVGVVAAVVPWNGPQIVIAGKLAAALVAGCTAVVKPSPLAPLDCYPLAEMIQEAGIPAGVVNIVPAGAEAGAHLVAHPGVDMVSFTGSVATGRRIGAVCGEQLKRCTLELGGKSAAIVLDDAELDATMASLRTAALINSGQTCVAQTRVLASRARYDEVVDALAETARAMRTGDPSDPATELGPLVSELQRERVEGYVELGRKEGARLVTGGERPFPRGWYVTPAVFADVANDMRIAREEIFGPVLTVIPYDDEDDAVRIANDSEFGLAGSVWTADVERGLGVARRVRTGTYGVNTYGVQACAPLGGYKCSGVGRELGREGLESYLECKSILHGESILHEGTACTTT
jgi:aldehyde dehydrogenase (NAD+)